MARLPVPQSDQGVWGDILNDFLSQAHATNGSIKANAVATAAIVDGAITAGKLSPASGSNGQVLTKNTGVTGGLEWAAAAGSLPSYPNSSGTATIVPRPSVIDVRDYGATGNGTTDDRAAISAALSALSAAGGGTLLFPAGTYAISATVSLASNVRLAGVGRGASIIRPAAGWSAAAMFQDPSAISNVELADLTFDVNNIDALAVRFIRSGTINVAVRNCEFKGMLSDGSAININLCRQVLIQGNTFTGLGSGTQEALLIYNAASHIAVVDNSFEGFNQSVAVDNFTAPCNNITIANNRFRNIGNYGVRLEQTSYATVTGNEFETTFYVGTPTDGSAAVTCHTGCNYVTISGNVSKAAGEMSTYDSFNTSIIGNTIVNPQAAGIEVNDNANTSVPTDALRTSIVGNHVQGAGGTGMFVSGADVLIQANTVSASQSNGLKIAEGGQRYLVLGNVFCNNGQDPASGKNGILIANNGDAGAITDSLIAYNYCYDNQVSKTQDNGLTLMNNPTTNIRVVGNDFTGNGVNAVSINTTGVLEFRQNRGYNNQGVASITVGASPFTYTAGNTPEAVYISGGTVSNISKNSATIFAAAPATVWLEPNEAITVTYSAAPAMAKDRK